MGRRPNALILQYFERGPKLQDQSNRYPHTCKSCGEHFPRGRIDSLTTHLTKRCPAISQEDRLNCLMALSGMTHPSHKLQSNRNAQVQAQLQTQVQGHVQAHGLPNVGSIDVPMMQTEAERDWTALGVLAEVSRHFDLNEKSDVPVQHASANMQPGSQPTEQRFELPEQFQGDSANPNRDSTEEKPKLLRDGTMSPTAEERLQEALRAEDANADSSNLTMAAAAAARLQPTTLLDPQLLGEEVAAAAAAEAASATVAAALASSLQTVEQTSSEVSPAIPITSGQPWGELTYGAGAFQTHPLPVVDNISHNMMPMKGGFRLGGEGGAGVRARHSRARFDPARRKQVQEVRKIGACIRCRVLRKTCSEGSPCVTCRKVLSPRVWRSGCVRTKFSETLDLYSAGVQVVLAQGRINAVKQSIAVSNNRLQIEARHFPDQESCLQLQVLQREVPKEESDTTEGVVSPRPHPVVMVDMDTQDVPARVEAYMREALPELIRREPSNFVQVTLQTAMKIASSTNDELLKKSLELWGLVELLDRERGWQMAVKTGVDDVPCDYIRYGEDDEVFTTICLQLSAAAERKASATSKALLTGMQRVLQDSKVKIDFNMYYAALILLNCVEKSTWAFRAWDQPNLRQLWPLEKNPGEFTEQGYVIADLLRMLLKIRKALPQTIRRESDGKLVTAEADPGMQEYFEAISLDCKFGEPVRPVSIPALFYLDIVKAKQDQPVFLPDDPRSFELLFCSTLLLPAA
ncbi:hypothetical protein V8F20_003589 [Naviculisporaceae sp. PSN 640]